MSTQLTQDEIDRLFRERGAGAESQSGGVQAATYDFRRPDRIPKEQLRSIHLMHDFLARNLASSLGAYLRAYVTVSLVSVEQLSFGEFLQYLPTPTCVSSVGMSPLDGNGVLEMNPTLVSPMIDILLGGPGEAPSSNRELTEIEQSIAEGILRIVLHDLHEAWAPVSDIDFRVEAIETQPQLMQILSSNEAIVAIGFEITLGEARGMMNFGVPSIMVKMMGQRFEQQWSIRRHSGAAADRDHMRGIVRRIPVDVDVRVQGAKMALEHAMTLEAGDVISLDVPVRRPADILINGRGKFEGEIVSCGNRRGVLVKQMSGGRSLVAGGDAGSDA